MFEKLTQSAREVVAGGVAHAVASTADETRPEHLFRALLDDPASPAVRLLADAGASLEELRAGLEERRLRYVDGLDADDAEALRVIGIDLDEVVRRIDRNLGAPSPRGRRRLSWEAKRSLELALREAVRLQHRTIGAEHLLLGLSRCGDRVVADTLAASGVDHDDLRERLAAMTSSAG